MDLSKVKGFIAIAAIVAVAFGIAPASRAATKTHTVSIAGTHIDDDGWTNWQLQSCSFSGRCKFKGSGIVDYTGPMHGISNHETWIWYDPSTKLLYNDTYEWYTVTIDGCGTGRFLTHESGAYPLDQVIAMQDPKSGKLQGGSGTWRLVPGTQTGDLTRMSSFWFTVKHVAFAFPNMENHETIDEGQAVCS